MYPPRSNTTSVIFFLAALLAINAPTSFAATLFACFSFISLSSVEAAQRVFPLASSII